MLILTGEQMAFASWQIANSDCSTLADCMAVHAELQIESAWEAMREGRAMGEKSVQLHGWQALPCGSQEYADHWQGEPCNGFCVYLRTDTPGAPEPFDISQEADFYSIEAAESYALQLATHNACEIERY